MRRLKIVNKRKFKKAIFTILMVIALIVGIILFANYIKVNGLASLFTINAYKESFVETNTTMINLLMGIEIGFVLAMGFALLLEKESEEQENYALEDILKRNGLNTTATNGNV